MHDRATCGRGEDHGQWGPVVIRDAVILGVILAPQTVSDDVAQRLRARLALMVGSQ